MMTTQNKWTRDQLLVAFSLYCKMPFGKMHSLNPDIIKYSNLIHRTPSALAMKLGNIASLDPEITSTGRKGLSGASETDRAMWNEMQSDWQTFAIETHRALAFFDNITELDTISLDEPQNYIGKTKEVTSTIRIGQDFFRRSVLSAYNNRCCITGLSLPKFLVASHIVPWRADEKNRLNPMNGVCLSVIHDKAFDSGVITIDDNMTVRVSKKYRMNSDPFFTEVVLSYDKKMIARPEKFYPRSDFLDYHRHHVFDE